MLVRGPYRLEPADRPDGQQLGGSFCPAGEVRPILGAQPLALHLQQKRACLPFIVSSDFKRSGQPLQQVVVNPFAQVRVNTKDIAQRGSMGLRPRAGWPRAWIVALLCPTYVGPRPRNVPRPVKYSP